MSAIIRRDVSNQWNHPNQSNLRDIWGASVVLIQYPTISSTGGHQYRNHLLSLQPIYSPPANNADVTQFRANSKLPQHQKLSHWGPCESRNPRGYKQYLLLQHYQFQYHRNSFSHFVGQSFPLSQDPIGSYDKSEKASTCNLHLGVVLDFFSSASQIPPWTKLDT